MKILHIATGYPLSFQGGITNYVRSLAEAQAEAGEDVTVLGGPDRTDFTFRYQEYHSVRILPFSFSKMLDKNALDGLAKFLYAEHFELIHIHMMLDIDRDFYQILQDYHYVISLHDYFFLCPRIQMLRTDRTLCTEFDRVRCSSCISRLAFNRHFMRGLCKISELGKRIGIKVETQPPKLRQTITAERFDCYKKLLEQADRVLPVSERVREIYENSGIKAEYQVLHIGNKSADVFIPEFIMDRSERKIRIVMIGSVNYSKGAELFLRIAGAVDQKKIEIHFWGRSNEYGDRIRKAGVIDHGGYRQEELGTILSEMDLGLILSVWEDNAPQVVMEYLNNHVPVIGTRMGGIPDFINAANGYLFNPYKEDEVRAAINFINNVDLEQIFRMKSKIMRTVTVGEHLRELSEVYANVLK